MGLGGGMGPGSWISVRFNVTGQCSRIDQPWLLWGRCGVTVGLLWGHCGVTVGAL